MTRLAACISVLFILLVQLIPGCPARADGPVSLGLATPIQIVPETESVTALRISLIYGKNVDIKGLDLGLIGHNTGDVTGLAVAGLSLVDGNFSGWQHGWIASVTQGNVQGLQTAFYNSSGVGSSGVQLGFLNTTRDFSGVQVGLVNITEKMRKGLQIGLINVIKSKDRLPVLPLLNWVF